MIGSLHHTTVVNYIISLNHLCLALHSTREEEKFGKIRRCRVALTLQLPSFHSFDHASLHQEYHVNPHVIRQTIQVVGLLALSILQGRSTN